MPDIVTNPEKLSRQILIGCVLGIIAGVFFGEYCNYLGWIGTAYTMLLEAVVFPYIICSLLHGLGKMSSRTSLLLISRGWWIYSLIILFSFLIIYILTWAIPDSLTSLSSPGRIAAGGIGLMQVLVPENIFAALAKNYVPAVVVFIIIFALATQKIQQKEPFLQILATISNICISFWAILVKLAPLGVFALLAKTAGTIHLSQLGGLSVYLILIFLGCIILTFWTIPLLISGLIPMKYGRVLSELKYALILTATTSIAVLALPIIQQISEKFLHEQGAKKDNEEHALVETVTLISYPFSQIGSFIVYLFIIFSAYNFNHIIAYQQQWLLPFLSFLSSIGTPNTSINSVSFLAHWLHLPLHTTELYASIRPITQYLQIPLTVMGITFVSIILPAAYYDKLKVRARIIVLAVVSSVVFCIGAAYLTHQFVPNLMIRTYHRIQHFAIQPQVKQGVRATVIPPGKIDKILAHSYSGDVLYQIQRTGILRVGYNDTAIPFSYFNAQGNLVGYDIAQAYLLAKSLHVNLVFVPFDWKSVIQDLNENKFDIVMSGAYVTPDRLQKTGLTNPYFKSPVSFIVPVSNKNEFSNLKQIQAMRHLRIAVDMSLSDLAHELFPNATLIVKPSIAGITKAMVDGKADVVISSNSQALMWAWHNQHYTVIVPKNLNRPVLLAYMVNKKASRLLGYINYWLVLQQDNEISGRLFEHWILGKPLHLQPRWSVWNNLL